MPTVGLIASKGGAGKTTLAVHLAVLAGDVLLVDLDPQRSAAEWAETRAAELPELAALGEEDDPRDLPEALAASERRWKFVDTAPHDLAAARIVASTVDLVLIPTRPGVLDLR